MICENCGREIREGSQFCTYCGTRVENGQPAFGERESGGAEIPPPSGEGTLEAQIQTLRDTVSSVVVELSRLSSRVAGLEGTRAARAATRPTSAAPPPSQQPQPAQASGGGTTAPLLQRGRGAGILGPDIYDRISAWNWEWLVGGNWMARIGVVALVIGVGFFLKLAFDNDWIGETGRVALGLVGGLAFLGAGEYWQRKYPLWSQPVTGGGIAILYLSIFAAFAYYQLIPPLMALGLSFLVTITAAGLALRYESFAIAVLGIIGGFLTPLLLREQLPNERVLLAYVLILDLGVLALATFRNWRWFTLLGLLGSLVLFWFWLDQLQPDLLLSQVGITAIFLIFMGATTLFHILWQKVPGPFDQALMVINAAAYFGISYGLLFDEFRPWMGGFTLLLALLYALLGYAVLKRSSQQVYLSFFAIGIALVFLTIAVPVQLGGPWVSVAWSVESAVLIWLSFQLRMNPLRWMGLGVFLIFGAWILFIDTPRALRADLSPFFNVYILSYALAIGITYLTSYLIQRKREELLPWEEHFFSAFLAAGTVFLTVAVPVQTLSIWLPISWAVEAIVLVWLSFRIGIYQLRLLAMGVLAVTVVRLLGVDTFGVDLETFRPVLNERFAAFGAGIVALYLAAYFQWRWREQNFHPQEMYVIPVYLAAANALTLWLLSAEIFASVDSELFSVPRGIATNVKSLSLSILWAIYAAALIVLGIARRWRWVRLAGLALLIIPVVKLFVFDVFLLEQGFRVAAFISLGAILVAGGFLYQRFRGAIRDFLLE